MSDTAPDYSLSTASGVRNTEKPELYLIRYFQIKEAEYMKPPLAEQLLEPDGSTAPTAMSLPGAATGSACVCNAVCTCVPVTTCACNIVCNCNTVNSSYGSVRSGGGGYGGYGGYWMPCF